MNLLLDTHILLWWLSDQSLLSSKIRKLISDADNMVFISAASIWEISIKKASGKLITPNDLENALMESDFQELPIHHSHANLAGKLPQHHTDPFDRMLIAQAEIEKLTLISHDRHFKQYAIKHFISA